VNARSIAFPVKDDPELFDGTCMLFLGWSDERMILTGHGPGRPRSDWKQAAFLHEVVAVSPKSDHPILLVRLAEQESEHDAIVRTLLSYARPYRPAESTDAPVANKRELPPYPKWPHSPLEWVVQLLNVLREESRPSPAPLRWIRAAWQQGDHGITVLTQKFHIKCTFCHFYGVSGMSVPVSLQSHCRFLTALIGIPPWQYEGKGYAVVPIAGRHL
jgi:hypothetical protein